MDWDGVCGELCSQSNVRSVRVLKQFSDTYKSVLCSIDSTDDRVVWPEDILDELHAYFVLGSEGGTEGEEMYLGMSERLASLSQADG